MNDRSIVHGYGCIQVTLLFQTQAFFGILDYLGLNAICGYGSCIYDCLFHIFELHLYVNLVSLFHCRQHSQPASHLADLLEIDPHMGLDSQPPLVDPWGMPISAPTTMAPSIPRSHVSHLILWFDLYNLLDNLRLDILIYAL